MKEIKCGTCGELFIPKSEKNKYCKRSCFKKAFYKRKKNEVIEITFPDFICQNCNKKVALDFDPIIDSVQWLDFRCPSCGILFINVSDELSAKDVHLTE